MVAEGTEQKGAGGESILPARRHPHPPGIQGRLRRSAPLPPDGSPVYTRFVNRIDLLCRGVFCFLIRTHLKFKNGKQWKNRISFPYICPDIYLNIQVYETCVQNNKGQSVHQAVSSLAGLTDQTLPHAGL